MVTSFSCFFFLVFRLVISLMNNAFRFLFFSNRKLTDTQRATLAYAHECIHAVFNTFKLLSVQSKISFYFIFIRKFHFIFFCAFTRDHFNSIYNWKINGFNRFCSITPTFPIVFSKLFSREFVMFAIVITLFVLLMLMQDYNVLRTL